MFGESVKISLRRLVGTGCLFLLFGGTGCESDSSVVKRCLGNYWSVPDFSLVNQDGLPFGSSEMAGKIWVVDFFYTTCPGPCPALTSRLSDVHRAFAGETRVGFLSISSDPVKDTPEVLKRYAERFRADQRWLFLTGDEMSVFKLANEGFKMGIAKVEGSPEPVTHSTKLALVDDSGAVRGFFEGVGEDDGNGKGRGELVKCIRHLLKNQTVTK
jgi:protein SCO1/2